MDIVNNIIPILFILGLIQGLIFGILLIYLNRKKSRSTLFLGIFVLAYSVDYIHPISTYLNLTDIHPILTSSPFDFRWFLFPIFYLYVRQVSILAYSKREYLYLIPGVIMLTINLLSYYISSYLIVNIWDYSWFNWVYYNGSTLFDVFMSVKIILFIIKHSKETTNQYSSTINKELEWAKLFVLCGIVFILIMHIRFVFKSFYLDLFATLVNVGFLYWISVRGIRQKNIESLILSAESVTTEKQNTGSTTRQKTDDDIELVKIIERYLLSNKEYLKLDLTIADVSNCINEHPKRVSNAINLVTKKNFKSYINSFRIKEAKQLLESNSIVDYSIHGIGLEVGFKSKSVFYNAFKKETGLTPHQYKTQSKETDNH
jgi:AraC-like DNA-binding protein